MKFFINFLLGIMFGFGLILSGIYNPKTANIFLYLDSDWNTPFLVTIGSILITSIIFIFVRTHFKLDTRAYLLDNPKKPLNRYSIFGSALYGMGWGLSGLCVSTAIINLAFNEWESTLFFIFMFLGFYSPEFVKKVTL